MIKLNFLEISDEEILEVCADNIQDSNGLKGRLVSGKNQLLESYVKYETLAKKQALYQIPASNKKTSNSPVIGKLHHDDLTKLYKNHFVPKEKKCRKYYNEILNLTDNCPYCSGIGETRTLDHYLIKSKFPQYAVLSKNLIPCCADCNSPTTGKGQSIAQSEEEQSIHPYFDKSIFFDELWVCAEYKDANYFIYYPCPPENWNEIDKKRAVNHFKSLNLNKRFSRFANNELPMLESQIAMTIDAGATTEGMIDTILKPWISDSLGVNHWKKLMYLSLISYYQK